MPIDGEFTPEEKKIIETVTKEIKSFGDTSKKNYDDLNKSHNELKALVKESEGKADIRYDERIEKLSTEILTRQDESDKVNVKRMDDIETSMQRLPKGDTKVDSKSMEEAITLKITMLAMQNKLTTKGVSRDDVNLKEIESYKSAIRKTIQYDPNVISGFLNADESKALSVGSDPDGGFTVTPQMSNKITQRLFESDPVRQLARVETISSLTFDELVDWESAGGDWEGETVENGETDTPQWRKKSVTAHVLAAQPRASQTLLEDSSINIESWLAGKIANIFSRTEAAAFVAGNGVGKPKGFLKYATGTDFGQVEQVNMGAAANLTTDGLIDVKYTLKEFFLQRASWLANRTTVSALMKLKDGDGQYIWRPGLEADRPSTLLGNTIRMSTTMPVVAANALSLAIADWTEAYLIVDRLGISVLRNPFRNPPMVEFYSRKRVGGDVINFDSIKIGKVAV